MNCSEDLYLFRVPSWMVGYGYPYQLVPGYEKGSSYAHQWCVDNNKLIGVAKMGPYGDLPVYFKE